MTRRTLISVLFAAVLIVAVTFLVLYLTSPAEQVQVQP
jgi:hypothetical protein